MTTVWLTAGVFHLLVDERITALRGLRQIVAGGDVLSPQHVNRVLAELQGCRMINGYEAHGGRDVRLLRRGGAPGIGHAVPIGSPILRHEGARARPRSATRSRPASCRGALHRRRGPRARLASICPEPPRSGSSTIPSAASQVGRQYRTGDRVLA